ncbi:aminotransferase class IV [Lentzea sp. NPDC006480]|uniref:aminotransferase class IV n=1 Tax=Lentzea sp. NPDC006480 TaxID=3157176 RepID=UPI0033BC3220
MSDQGVRRWWDDDGWSPSDATGQVRVIDSWLVDEGRVRGFSLHAQRFADACSRFAEASRFATPATGAFLRAVAESLPERGRWFPRVELVETAAGPRLRLWVRPAPPRTRTVRLWNSGPDRRSLPAVKGVDLDHLAGLRTAAVAAGADEALLLSPEGHVLEGSTTSIVWWRGDTLCGPPPGPGLLPGITRALLGELAGQVVPERATPAGLADVPVWTVNALHGIRPVTAGLGRFLDEDVVTAERWQTRLESLAVPLKEVPRVVRL